MTDQTADRPVSLTELEIRSELFDAMDGNLRMSRRRELLDAYRDAVLAAAEPEPRTFADGGVNDIRQLYAVQGAIADAGGELTRPVHKAIDALREVWDRELRREQQRNVAVVSAPVQPTELAKQIGLRDYWHQEAMSATTRIIELEAQVEQLRTMYVAVSAREHDLIEERDELRAQANLDLLAEFELRGDTEIRSDDMLRRMAGEEQPATETDTLPAWLRQRFTASSVDWENLDDSERSYWEHQARAVRRAVARNGFKPAVVARQDGATT